MQTKYIILFWIIALVLFTFYCLFRLSYMHKTIKANITQQIPKASISMNSSNALNKFADVADTDTDNITNITEALPIDAITYLNNILTKDKITDIKECENVYDDNLGVRALGYSTCGNAFTDYFNRGLDPDKKYGFTKSLSNYCPITTKNPTYMQCMRYLLTKFTDNVNITKGLNEDMIDNINSRLQERSNILNNIEETLNPHNLNKDITIDYILEC